MARISQLKARIDRIFNTDTADIDFEKATNEILRLSVPSYWNARIKGNAEVSTERDFEQLLLAIGQHTNEPLDKITVFRFYSLIAFLKEKNKQ